MPAGFPRVRAPRSAAASAASLLLVLAACGGGGERRPTPAEPVPPVPVVPPPPAPAPARLRVRVAGRGYDITLAEITAALDSGPARPVPEAGTAVFDSLVPGPRSVRLAGVGATCAVSGPNPRALTLAAGRDTTVTFDVVCRTRVARVALGRAYESVLAGDTLMLAAIAYAADGSVLTGRPVTWATTAPAALAVTPAGVATGGATGVARITASVDGVEGGAEVTVFAPNTRAPRGFSYVADSAVGSPQILYRLRYVPADGSPARTLGGPTAYVGGYAWAPTGDRVLVTYAPRDGRPAGTYVVDADAGRERLLGQLWGSYAWAPDGARIAYAPYDAATGDRSVEVLDLRDNSTRVVLPSSGDVAGVAWSPDGRRLAVLRRPVAPGTDNPFALAVVSLGGGAARDLALPTRAMHVAWSPDGKRLAYDDGTLFAPPSAVWVVDVDGREARRLDVPCPAALGADCTTGFPSWSPDGRRIALQQLPRFLANTGRQVTFPGVDDGALSAVPAGGPCCDADSPRWSGDGRMVLLAAARPAPDYSPSVARIMVGGTAAEFLTAGTNVRFVEWVP